MDDWVTVVVKVGLGLGCVIFLALIYLTMVALDLQEQIISGKYRSPGEEDRKHDRGQDGHQGADQGSQG